MERTEGITLVSIIITIIILIILTALTIKTVLGENLLNIAVAGIRKLCKRTKQWGRRIWEYSKCNREYSK